jgi:hypothetical protein
MAAAIALATLSPYAGASAADTGLPEPVGMAGDPSANLVLAGNRAFLHGDLVTATRDYRAALKGRPTLAVAEFNLGLVEMHGSGKARGLADMDRGIVLAHENGMSARFVAKLRALRAAFSPVAAIETT